MTRHHRAAQDVLRCLPTAMMGALRHACAFAVQVFSGLDYVSADRNLQHAALKTALVEHLKKSPQALIVIDEYDKMDCETQFMFRQLIQGSHNAKLSMNRWAFQSR